jgi:hypothetical protein
LRLPGLHLRNLFLREAVTIRAKVAVLPFMMSREMAVQRVPGLAERAGFVFDRKLGPPRAMVSHGCRTTRA